VNSLAARSHARHPVASSRYQSEIYVTVVSAGHVEAQLHVFESFVPVAAELTVTGLGVAIGIITEATLLLSVAGDWALGPSQRA
jgi:hypothetical protein